MYFDKKENVQISILVPVYNLELYVGKCLESITNQTYDEFEVILVDDGSNDSTLEIAQKHAMNDKRIRVFHTKNKGVSAARQLALENAKGKYIVSVDGDDWIEHKLLEEVYELCIKNNADAVCFGWFKESSSGVEYNAPTLKKIESVNGMEMIKRFYLGEFHGTLTCYMFAKHLFEGFAFPKNISVGCDFAALFYAMQRAKKVITTSHAYYHYIQRSGSAVHSGYSIGKLNAYYFEKEMKIKALKLLPQISDAIIIWYIQNNVFLVSSMCRSKIYNRAVVKKISKEIRKNYFKVLVSNSMKLPFKLGALLLGGNGYLYILLYSFFYRFAGSFYTKLTNNVSGGK